MFDAKLTQADFSRASREYAVHAQLQARIGEVLIQRSLPFIAKDAALLDVGAGPGEGTQKWGAKSIALDAAFGMCREAGKRLPAVQARAENLPIKSGCMDAVASNLMLQWLPAPKVFFDEAARVLKKDGILAISNFAAGTLAELSSAFSEAGEHHRMSDFVPAAALATQVKDAGFEIVVDDVTTTVEYYADMLDLFLYLRDIGAVNKRINRPRGMLTMRKLREISSYYPRELQGIPVSWVTQMIVARKL